MGGGGGVASFPGAQWRRAPGIQYLCMHFFSGELGNNSMLNDRALLKHRICLYVLVKAQLCSTKQCRTQQLGLRLGGEERRMWKGDGWPVHVGRGMDGRFMWGGGWMAGTCGEGDGWPVHVGRGMDGRFMWGGEWMAGSCGEGNGWPVHVGRGVDGRYM